MPDVIVIGAGHNGLTAACYLANAGRTVTVVEANDWVDGMATSRPVVTEAPRHLLNPGAIDVPCDPSPVSRELDLASVGLRVESRDPAWMWLGPTGESLQLHQDPAATIAEIQRFPPKDALPVPSSDDGATEHARVLALREALYGALFAHDTGAGQLVTDELQHAIAAADYDPTADGWRWRARTLTAATPRHRIAQTIMALLARSDLHLLHQCEDAQCGSVFLDTSRAHNRRWCVTKDCGDRNRSRAYHVRQKTRT